MRKIGIDEWLVHLVQSMYKDVRSRVRVGDGYSEEFGVGVGVHQGSVLSPLLFIIVLEALSREFRTGCLWELLYADDLMISAESMEEMLVKVQTWKTEMEKKGLHVNVGKTKIMESGINLDVLKKSGKYPCGVCQSGVGSSNAIFCGGCKCWVHKKCSDIKGPLHPDPEFRCTRCLGTAWAIDEREVSEIGHVERSTGWIAEVRKLNVVAQKRSGRPRKSWDEVLENDRKKLGMDSADPQNRSEWRGRLRERLVKKPNPRSKSPTLGRGKQGSKMDMMMMMMTSTRLCWKSKLEF